MSGSGPNGWLRYCGAETQSLFERSHRIYIFSRVGFYLLKMGRLVLMKPVAGLRQEAKALAELRTHILHLQEIYKKRSANLIKAALSRSGLDENIRAVEVMPTEDGIIVRFDDIDGRGEE